MKKMRNVSNRASILIHNRVRFNRGTDHVLAYNLSTDFYGTRLYIKTYDTDMEEDK